jgi:hypothetical protein
MGKPTAALSLDLDNKWSYMKTHGDAGWDSHPSYLGVVVPRVLEFMKARGLTITFFIVGQDADLEKNKDAFSAIGASPHDIGNHSFLHEPWLHLYSEEEIDREIGRADEAIRKATGKGPIGFRGPGFSLSMSTLRVLERRGYQYDASTLPTYLGPLARAYYFLNSRFTKAEREQREALFGQLSDGLRPVKPYIFRSEGQRMLEVPVTTMPLFKVPIHVSYVLYLAQYSRALARAYFQAALALCRATGTRPSLLLHPLDFLGGDDEPDLAFFPAMGLRGGPKLEVVSDCLQAYQDAFDVQSLNRFVTEGLQKETLPEREPVFHNPPPPGGSEKPREL